MLKLHYGICILLCAESCVHAGEYAAEAREFDKKAEKEKKLRPARRPSIAPIVAASMLIDIPEDKEGRIIPPPSPAEGFGVSNISSPSFPFYDTLTPRSFGDKSEPSTSHDHKELSSSDPLIRVQLPDGRTARCALNAFCTADLNDIEQKLQECRMCIQHIQKNNPERLDLFIQELKNARVYVAGRVALRVGDISQQRDEMVMRLTSVLTPRSEFSEEEYKIFKANLYRQLDAYHQSMQAQRRPKKHCPGCCGGCDVL